MLRKTLKALLLPGEVRIENFAVDMFENKLVS